MTNPVKKCRVALLMLRNSHLHKALINYVFNALDYGLQNTYDPAIIMFVDGHEMEMQIRIKQLVLEGFDIFISIGQICTLAVKHALETVGGHPTIFIGVVNPVQHQLVNSLEYPGTYMTGVFRESMPMEKIVSKYICLKPFVRSIVIPYVPTLSAGLLTSQAIELKKQFAAHGIQVFAAPIQETRESLFEVLETYRPRVQSVLFLEGCYSNVLEAQVAYYCWQNALLFCGSGINALNNGAACAFSGDIKNCAATAYQMLRSYWEDTTPIGTIPVVVHPDNQELFVNTDMLRRIKFPEEKIAELERNSTIKVLHKWVDSPEHK
jgi:ABC-type uncharacterized transport system substrate-binding protein